MVLPFDAASELLLAYSLLSRFTEVVSEMSDEIDILSGGNGELSEACALAQRLVDQFSELEGRVAVRMEYTENG